MADVTDYTGLITSEHADKPNFMAMVSAVAQCFVDQIGLLQSMPDAFDLDKAVGPQLDAVGLWIGLSRAIAVPIGNVYFSWDTADVGYDQGIWKQPGDAASGVSSMDDDTYRLMLRAKIGANHWDGSMAGSVPILQAIFAGTGASAKIIDNQDMTMDVVVTGGSLTALVKAMITQGYIPLKPVGVSASYTFIKPTQQIILTGGSVWAVPADWNNANNSIELIGGGESGWIATNNNGGAGGDYAKKSNLTLSAGSNVSYHVGLGGAGTTASSPNAGTDSWFSSTATVLAKGGGSASTSIGDVIHAGGAIALAGGGGAGGPNGPGNSSTSIAGGSGDAGHGGSGGNAGFPGGSGTEWGAGGSGGGGGGSATVNGGNGGSSGGGGGGARTGHTSGSGANGLIVITYTPA